MITLRWCQHCQTKAAHRDGDTNGGTAVWANGTHHWLPDGYVENVCIHCGAHTLDYHEDAPSDPHGYTPPTTADQT